MKNLAYDRAYSDRINQMRKLMKKDLQAIGRPFGEFITGGNATDPGQIDWQIEIVKQIEIQGKKVTVPDTLRKKLGSTAEPDPDDKSTKKAKREARREAREKVRSKIQERSDK